MIVSDSKTPQDFQIEIIDELNKEVRRLAQYYAGQIQETTI